ncbi:GNAT family N-acetyltransferase [Paenibacillus sp. NFR01]|uniref:GNAT family N-acetyltransferase n=1 Tax=Paenibacillus sp. NFR01 TaxID=1566279 RepID=UPI0008D05572|nr:GNAT family protein [Paenibacillus sp. NFR01]SET93431.1 Protein N-acetyltransferase, RimJ/RimL family [Paenibacillus sp. NFR01]
MDHGVRDERISSKVRLEAFTEKYREALLDFYLPPEQLVFTALPAETLDAAIADPQKLPVVVLQDGVAAGFFILHVGEAVRDFAAGNPRAVLLRAYLIDYKMQSHGAGTRSLALLPDFAKVHFPGADEIVLAVNVKNAAAARLYLKAGFRDNGLRREGLHGPQRILQYKLKKEAWLDKEVAE